MDCLQAADNLLRSQEIIWLVSVVDPVSTIWIQAKAIFYKQDIGLLCVGEKVVVQ
jgi:hypothetical protein